MIQIITDDTFPRHFEAFGRTARSLFPALGYSDVATQQFITNNAAPYDDTVFEVDVGEGHVVYGRKCDGWEIVYLMPSDWDQRYRLLDSALAEIRAWYRREAAGERLVLRIEEQAPSHGVYFLGTLPQHGFTLLPRVHMTASADAVAQTVVGELPQYAREVPFRTDRLQELERVFSGAHSPYQTALSPALHAWMRRSVRDELRQAVADEECTGTWVCVEHGGTLAGSCFGRNSGGRLLIEELAALPHYWGRGLGRYLLLRCMQRLQERYGGPGSTFVLDTWRTYDRAMRLYEAVGFQPCRLYTEAMLIDEAT